MAFLFNTRKLVVVATALLLASGSVYADKPDKDNGNGHGNGKGNSQGNRDHGKKSDRDSRYERDDRDNHRDRDERYDRDGRRDSGQNNVSLSFSFGSNETRIVRDYYGGQVSKGKCPPGLAKKGNGCQPPGQARQWQRGQPLGRDIRYYDIPNDLRIRLPVPPLNHKYVQLGKDLLLIAVGTAIVVDAVDGIF